MDLKYKVKVQNGKEISMKRVGVVIDDELHRKLRVYAINHNKTITSIIVELIKKELETKKE